jgi:uncharacterized protein YdhG (YjbR/CyaY superfamily)
MITWLGAYVNNFLWYNLDKEKLMTIQDYKNVDEYIAQFPTKTQELLEKVRQTIFNALPTAEEKISYGIPTFVVNGKNIVHVGAYESHIGFYPGAFGVEHFKDKLTGYKTSKGTIQFPLDKPIPYDLISEITQECAANRSAKS